MLRWQAIVTRSTRGHHQLSTARRWLHSSDSGYPTRPSRHAQFYSDLVPAMVPIALLGSAVYMGLQLLQTHLSHEKYLDEARTRIKELEQEIDVLLLERGRTSTSPLPVIAAKDTANTRSWSRWLRGG